MSTSTPPAVTTTRLASGVARVTLDDPANRNCVDAARCAELAATFDALAADASLKVLVVAGTRDVFCGGGTLATVKAFVAGVVDPVVPRLLRQLAAFPVPTVAAVEGSATGGGLMYALACDTVVAAEERRYGFPFTSMGFTPGEGATTLPGFVGHQIASEMLYGGKFYRGRELRGTGLFAHVVPHVEVMPLALDLAARIAEKPRHVLALLKEELVAPRLRALDEAMARERRMHDLLAARPDTAATIDSTYSDWASARRPKED